MNIEYDFDFADITKTIDIVNTVKEYGICRVPNYLDSDTLSKVKADALELVTNEPADDYEFGKATRFFRQQTNKIVIRDVFGSSDMDNISKEYLGRGHNSNNEVFITHDYKHDNGLARNGYLHFDRIYTFKYFIYLTDVNN